MPLPIAPFSRARTLAILVAAVLALPAGAGAEPSGLAGTLDVWTALESTQSACRQGAPSSVCDGELLLGIGGSLLGRLPSGFALGAGADAGAELFGAGHATFGALAGVSLEPRPWMQIDLLAESGLHEISGVGNGMFTDVDGPNDAALPYAGVRIGWTARFGNRVRFVVGTWLVARFDLSQQTLHLRTQSSGLFGDMDDSSWDDETWRVGGATLLACSRLGVEIR